LARHLSNWIKTYAEYTKHLEAPDYFHFWTAVSTIAGALRGKVYIDMGYFKWKPNFFIIYVGPPGIVNKSTTMNTGMELLRVVPEIIFGPDSATWQGLTSAFEEAQLGVDTPKGFVTMSCITVAASELGTFLDPKNREMIDILVDLWDGRAIPWKRRLKHEGESTITNPWLNFIGCTTPAWIEGNFPQYAIGGGFASRTVFVYGERKRNLVSYPKRLLIERDFSHIKQKLVDDLIEISKLVGEYHLSEEAFAWGDDWYKDHWLHRGDKFNDERFGGYIARKQTHLHKVAMVLAASRHEDMTIDLEDLVAAEAVVTDLEEQMPLVFSRVTDSRDARYSAAVVTACRQAGRATKESIWRRLFTCMSKQEFDLALQGAIMAGYVREINYGDQIVIEPLEEKLPVVAHGTAAQTSSDSESPESVGQPPDVGGLGSV
jgi:hypothetical protein